FAQKHAQSLLSTLRLMELEHRFWRGDISGALAVTRQLAPMIPGLPGSPHNAEFRFYACLAHLAAGGAAEGIETWRADLARYAESCPHNLGHMPALVQAQRPR